MDNPKTTGRFVAFLLFIFFYGLVHSQPVITEVMFRPELSTGEFVEFYNQSADSLDPNSIRFRDGYTTTSLIHVSGPPKIPPFTYAILIDKDHFDSNGIPGYEIPSGVSVFKTSNASIGNGLGNTSDFISILHASSGDTLTKIMWTNVSVDAGISIEKRNLAGPTFDSFPSLNWVESVQVNGTPGHPFSGEIPLLHDAGVSHPVQLSDTSFSIWVKNNGVLSLNELELQIAVINTGFVSTVELSALSGGDSILSVIIFPRFLAGTYLLTVTIADPDDHAENNYSELPLMVSDRPETDFRLLSVNYNPHFPVEGEPIWLDVTVTNAGYRTIPASDLQVRMDEIGLETIPIPALAPDDTLILSSSYLDIHAGIHEFNVEWIGLDHKPVGNTKMITFPVHHPWPVSDLRLTEIMANPDGSDAGNEFIEIINLHPSDSIPVSLLSVVNGVDTLYLEPADTNRQFLKAGQTGIIFSPGYFDNPEKLYDDILATSSTVLIRSGTAFSIKNKTGEVKLTGNGKVVDSFRWNRDSGDGKSWERLDNPLPHQDRFWDISADINGTPGFWSPPELPAISLDAIKKPVVKALENSIHFSGEWIQQGKDTISNLYGELTIRYENFPDFRESTTGTFTISGEYMYGDTIRISEVTTCDFTGSLQINVAVFCGNTTVMNDSLFLDVEVTPGTIVLNEVFPGNGQCPPFIEIKNTSSLTIYPDGWRIQSGMSSKSSIYTIPYGLLPGKTGLIIYKSDTTYFPVSGFPVFTAASFPDLSSGSGLLRLYDQSSTVQDSIFIAGVPGSLHTYERVDSAGLISWRESRFSGGTPGYGNSWPISFTDLSVSIDEDIHGITGADIQFSIRISNTGLSKVFAATVVLISGSDTNQVYVDDLPAPGESDVYSFQVSTTADDGWLTIHVLTSGDERLENNQIKAFIHLHPAPGSVRISEIMFDPPDDLTGHSIGDWVELVNVSEVGISLRTWSFRDGAGTTWYLPDSAEIAAGGYFLIASDSSFLDAYNIPDQCPVVIVPGSLNLNADEDVACLTDQWGWVSDSVSYSDSWHHPDLDETKGVSLERRSPTLSSDHPGNWISSGHPSGGTPGFSNTATVNPTFHADGFRVSPPVFFPENGQVCELSWNFPSGIHSTEIQIFDRIGRKIRELKPYGPAAATGVIFWDGRRSDGNRLPVGPYILLQTARNLKTGDLVQKKAVVIIARPL